VCARVNAYDVRVHMHTLSLSVCLFDLLLSMIQLNVEQYWKGILLVFQMHLCHFTCLIGFDVHLMQLKPTIANLITLHISLVKSEMQSLPLCVPQCT
jgi:hypothetical protein